MYNNFTLSHFFNVVKSIFNNPFEAPQEARTILVNVDGKTHILQVSLWM